MYLKNILVAYDSSTFSNRAFKTALDLAEANKSKITLATVVTGAYDPSIGFSKKFTKDEMDKRTTFLKKLFSDLQDRANKKGVKLALKILHDPFVSKAIVNYTNSHKFDLIAIGSHGRTGVKKFLLGSVANHVAHRASIPVMVVKKEMPITDILVPFDGSSFSIRAFNAGLNIAKKQNAKIKVLTCLEKENLGAWYVDKRLNKKIVKDAKAFAMKFLSKLEKKAEDSGVPISVHVVETKSISKHIVDFTKSKRINLIVIGSHGQTGLNKFLLGSVSNAVSQSAKCPVLIIK